MQEADIYNELNKIVSEVLGLSDLRLTPNMAAQDVEGWDSINHISIIVGVQSRFGIKFTTRQIDSIATAGDLVRFIEVQLAARKGH